MTLTTVLRKWYYVDFNLNDLANFRFGGMVLIGMGVKRKGMKSSFSLSYWYGQENNDSKSDEGGSGGGGGVWQ